MSAPPTSTGAGLSFGQLREHVEATAAQNLPDAVVPLASLTALPDGRIEVPGAGPLSLTAWSRRQLGALTGVAPGGALRSLEALAARLNLPLHLGDEPPATGTVAV